MELRKGFEMITRGEDPGREFYMERIRVIAYTGMSTGIAFFFRLWIQDQCDVLTSALAGLGLGLALIIILVVTFGVVIRIIRSENARR